MLNPQEISGYLSRTLELALEAFDRGNYPIGSLIVNAETGATLEAGNECVSKEDLTAHAEITVLRHLNKKADKHYPANHYLFSSLEPCFGCSFFIARSNITHIYSALKDPHKGGVSDLRAMPQFESFFSPLTIVNEPISELAERSRNLMYEYFLQANNQKAAAFYKENRNT